ncbi:MAG: protoheme IX farnesyltransferase [Chloroflexi bacterium]|nr:protoheme IX farnesyltransferase [Chloroflexota bacterium]
MVSSTRENRSVKQNMRAFRNLLITTSIMTFLLIVMGGIVRVTGSGLGCPDWPKCFGEWIPPMRADAIIEYLHRLIATLTSPLILASAVVAWRRFREAKLLSMPLFWSVALLGVQGLLGGLVVYLETPPNLVAVHLGIALIILGLILISTVAAFKYSQDASSNNRMKFISPFSRLSILVLVTTFIVLVSGALVASFSATYACIGWPLCNGHLFPSNYLAWVHMAHRLIVSLASLLFIYLFLRAWRTQRSQRATLSAATLAVSFFYAQALVGALKVTQGFPVYLLGIHVATAAAVWAAVVVLAAMVGLEGRTPEEERIEAATPADAKQRAKDLLSLTKPVIVVLLLVTTFTGMVVGAGALPPIRLVFWTMLAGAFAAGGSGAVNQYIDRELDKRMTRTSKRPIASGRMTAAEGLAFGLALLVAAFYILVSFVNLIAALLALAGMLYYILLYSLFLKGKTDQNIVIGGGAGAIPPLVGWAAATGSLSMPAIFLFAIIFLWTPPHFWALALIRRNDYERAGIPMMPVVRGKRETRWQIWLYTIELVSLTLLMPIFNLAGSIYLISAVLLGAALLFSAWKVWQEGGNKLAWRMYRYSSMYLALLFLALMLDALI